MKFNIHNASRTVISVIIVTGIITSLANAQNTVENLLVGDTKVQMLNSYKGAEPLPKPDNIVVYDFNVPDQAITVDTSAAARLQNNGLLSRIKGDADASPAAVARHVQASFTKALVNELSKSPLPTERAASANANPAMHTLLVHGDFTTVNQGNKSKRVMIGFGRGASDVQAHVTVFLMTEKGPVVLAEFNLNSESGKKPGAAATMGFGSAAVSAATGSIGDIKETVEADAARMAKAVAKQIENVMAQERWIAVPQSQASQQAHGS